MAFLWAGEPGGAMLGLWSLGTAPMGMRLHVAFAAELDEVLRAPQALAPRASAALVLPRGGRRAERDRLDARRGRLLRRPDGHMLEYLAMLDEPPRPEAGVVTWSDWARASV